MIKWRYITSINLKATASRIPRVANKTSITQSCYLSPMSASKDQFIVLTRRKIFISLQKLLKVITFLYVSLTLNSRCTLLFYASFPRSLLITSLVAPTAPRPRSCSRSMNFTRWAKWKSVTLYASCAKKCPNYGTYSEHC